MQYKLFVNGTEFPVSLANVSAYPINRVWPGHQRNIEQTEVAYFANIDISGKTDIRVETDEVIISPEIRPFEFEIPFEFSNKSIDFSIEKPMQITVEINGYHNALHLFFNEPFEYEKMPDDIYFGKGIHYPGLITLKNNQRLVLDNGAVVHGIVYARNANNISIIGRGILDASLCPRLNDYNVRDVMHIRDGLVAMGLSEKDIYYTGMFNVYGCKNVIIDGIVLKDSQFWTLIVRNMCKNVLINNIKIIGQWRYNSDGVDICCSDNVTLKNSFIRSFDDCVVVRGTHLEGEIGGCKDIVVENNVLWCDWGKNLEIWSGNKDSKIEKIAFSNNFITHVQMNAISIDTWFGSESIVVDGVSYKDIYIDSDKNHMPMYFQTNDNEKYVPDFEADIQRTIYINARLGKSLGNQAIDLSADTSGINVYYRNISFDNIVCDKGKMNITVNAENLKELSNVTINGYDYKDYCENYEKID